MKSVHSGKDNTNASNVIANHNNGAKSIRMSAVPVLQQKEREDAVQLQAVTMLKHPDEEQRLPVQGRFDSSPQTLAGQMQQCQPFRSLSQSSVNNAYHDTAPKQSVIQSRFVTQRHETGAVNEATQLKRFEPNFSPVQKKANNTGLPDDLKSGVEHLSGFAMDDVKVHYNSAKPATLQAHAYAQGTDIHLAPGQEKHLSHEAWHVAQQKQGRVRPTLQMKGMAVNDDSGLEKEADVMGGKALQALHTDRELYELHTKQFNIGAAQLRSAIVQREIKDSEIKRRIKEKYIGCGIDSVVLNILLEDAFEKADSFENAVERVDKDLMHHKAIFGPVEKPKRDIIQRPAIVVERDKLGSDFQSSVPKKKTDKSATLSEWQVKNTEKFYETVRASLKIARDPKHANHAKEKEKLDNLINAYGEHRDVKDLIDKYVRVKAKKAEGATTGTGLDELLKTSETMKYLELSYRPPLGMSPIAHYKEEEFDWMDVQQQLRLSTEFIIWAGDLVGEISGHTGTFQKEYKMKWVTPKQDLMHEVRDHAISSRSNPATAIIEAITTHLRITETVYGFGSDIYKEAKASSVLLPSGRSIEEKYAEIKVQLGKHRDMLKTYLDNISENAKPPAPSSPMQGRLGSVDYYPVSPKQSDDAPKINDAAGQVKGNPLPNLASQWRYPHNDKPKPIPEQPINSALQKARDEIKTHLGTEISAQIHNAAKGKVPRGTDPKEKDQKMIEEYLKKLQKHAQKAGVQKVIDDLEAEKLRLASSM